LAATLAVFALTSSARAQEVVLKAQTALPANHDLSVSFLKGFVDRVNEVGKGIVQIDYKGGPEVTPPDKAAPALQRGVFDMLHTPAAYHTGIVPQGRGLMATNLTPSEYRANGAFDKLAPLWAEKLNAKILAIGETGAQFHLYLVDKPKLTSDGVLDLTGVKIRTTGAYRPLVEALGGTPVQITNAGEVFTALERGLVGGFGWPTVGLNSQGLAKHVKYRIDPPFYHLANVLLVNLDTWNKLPKAAQDLLAEEGAKYEEASIAYITAAGETDAEGVRSSGVEVFALPAAGAEKYLEIAYGVMWDQVGQKLSPEETADLRAMLYKTK
jgi:TRAP-type C4-dicarboxylate transport system substrate-binding protein